MRQTNLNFLWSPFIKHNKRLTFSCNFNCQHSLFMTIQFLMKITRFWRSTHNANSPLFLSFSFTLGQTNYIHKRFHFNSSSVSRDISRTVEVGIWFFPYTNGYLERSSASVTSCLSHCSLSFLINYLVFWRFACCKPCLCDFNLSES